jgi:holo-[acyl-carrier protein] synthase
MTILGVGVDLVHVPSFGDQLDRPGTGFEAAFLPGERSDAGSHPSDSARHFAARWAAKEAVIKAWSASLHGAPPVMDEHVHHLIELVTDAWGRPRVRLHGEVAKHLDGLTLSVSLSHDGEYAVAYVILSS